MKKENKKHGGGAKPKEKKDIFQIKDFVPSNLIDKVIPQQPLQKISVNNIEGYNPEHAPNTLFPEWENKSITIIFVCFFIFFIVIIEAIFNKSIKFIIKHICIRSWICFIIFFFS